MLVKRYLLMICFVCAALLSACANSLQSIDDPVTITQSNVTWETFQYELTDFNTIFPGSYDGKTRTQHTFETWVLENEFLRVTLLPEFGGRILSILYKPTGHEELYQNPVGVPYQIDTNIFYYNWLMVYGGIFPTFPEPEHGKTWFMPWSFEIIEETDDLVTVAMSYTDDDENKLAPRQYNVGVTGVKVTFFVTLAAGRAALDTMVLIENPGAESVSFEYWTNTTLAPGSAPGDPHTSAQAEIIAPVDMIKIPSYWESIAAQEKRTGLIDVYEFDALRHFNNWTDMGIAYAFPDMGGENFWGVINHENQEGIFRIADNSLTPGLKIWTWGYPQTVNLDPYTTAKEARPYIELWAGLKREFWQRTELSPESEVGLQETYAPSVGLSNVTHANRDFLVNIAIEEGRMVTCQIFGLNPNKTATVVLSLDDTVFFEDSITLSPELGNEFSTVLPNDVSEGLVRLLIQDDAGNELFSGSVTVLGE